MPCQDSMMTIHEDHSGCQKRANELKKRLDRVTQLLCYLCGELEGKGALVDYDPRVGKWFEEHHRNDVERVSKKMDEVLKRHDFSVEDLVDKFISDAEKVHPVSWWHHSWFKKMAQVAVSKRESEKQARLSKKSLVKSALSKLSPEEKSALGLK
jgi:tetrahydromethanopterin S-methyltransferase subunit G